MMSIDDRYSRQILFPGIREEGQRRLTASRIVVVGCGATGSSICGLLARAGVGYIRIVDRDYVEPSNLQRQTLFDEADAAESTPKAVAATHKIASINSSIEVDGKVADLTPKTADELLGGTHLILDGTDNFETRFLINDYAVKNKVPWIYGAAVGSYGVTMNIIPGETACLACLLPEAPRGMIDTCDTSGILNSAADLVAAICCTEALKILVNAKAQLRRTLLSVDVWLNQCVEVASATRDQQCKVCAAGHFEHLARVGRSQITLCGRNSVQIHESERAMDFAEIASRLQPHGTVRYNEMILKFWRNGHEITLFPDGRAIIKGTTDAATARSLYARFIGN